MNWPYFEELIGNGYVVGVIVFVLWCLAAFVLKTIVFRVFRGVARRTSRILYVILIDSLNLPLYIIIPFVGLSLVWKVLPMNETFEFYMNLLTKIAVILSITFFVDRFIHGLFVEHDKKLPAVQLSRGLIQGLVRVVIYVLGIFILLDTMGVSISPLLASLGIGTLAVALALQSTLANFFSGLFVMADKSINVGDFVQLESGEMGYVDEIGWRASRVRLLTNNHVIIPNAKLVDSVVTNYQAPEPKLYIMVIIGVHYDSDLEHVERVVMDVARQVVKDVDGTVKEEEPSVWFREFDESSINFRVRVACKDFISQYAIQHELIKRIHKRFNEEGIVIPFPLRTLDLQPKHIKLFRELTGGKKDKAE
jgi:small-conductance mechanosensitive channel